MKELEAARRAKDQLTLYDAVPSAGAAEAVDPEVAKFLPLLQDYLKRTPRPAHLTAVLTGAGV